MSRFRMSWIPLVSLALLASSGPAKEPGRGGRDAYAAVIDRAAGMTGDARARRLAEAKGLTIVDLTWEDTGRYKGSSVGPNISDMTIQVHRGGGEGRPPSSSTCMPVMRFPNFSDRTADLDPEAFGLLVGNERGEALRRVNLREYLEDFRSHLHDPASWKGTRRSLLAERDTHVLVSAQACFLPIPREGEATFNPVLFNYQSRAGDPAVLAILVTREGTSATVIDNQRDGFQANAAWGQRLFFNADGQRASLTGKRESDWRADNTGFFSSPDEAAPEAGEQQGLNMVLLIQVPLKQKNPMTFAPMGGMMLDECMVASGAKRSLESDVEDAVIGHGELEGPFVEVDGVEIERDERFPVRVTVQFYKATSNGVVSEQDVREIHDQIERVYADADYVGSLVVEGETDRPTEHDGPKVEPPDWWDRFWIRHMKSSGMTREEAILELRRRFGEEWRSRPREELTHFLRWETW